MRKTENCLDLTVLDMKGQSVIGVGRRGGDIVIGELPLGDNLKSLEQFRDRIRKSLEPGPEARPDDDALAEFGLNLFKFCFAGQLRDLYARADANTVMNIQLLTNRQDLKAIPWEYMQEAHHRRGPRKDRSISRIVPSVGFDHKKSKLRAKVKVLFAASIPN